VTLFVDSSGILALVDRDDPAPAEVLEGFTLGRSEALSTHAHVIVETLAVARRRYGPAVAADLIDRVIPALDVAPVDAELRLHAPGGDRERDRPRRRLSNGGLRDAPLTGSVARGIAPDAVS